MSTTVELLAANERYERLRAAVEELIGVWENGGGYDAPNIRRVLLMCSVDLRNARDEATT